MQGVPPQKKIFRENVKFGICVRQIVGRAKKNFLGGGPPPSIVQGPRSRSRAQNRIGGSASV